MQDNPRWYDWMVEHNRNLAVVMGLSLAAPEQLLKSIYSANKGKARNWNGKNSCFTLSFDCDYPRDAEAIPQTLKLLSRHGVRASFACVGHWIERYPEIHREVVREGHEIMNHTYSHPDNEILNPGRKFLDIPRAEKLEEVQRCHQVCEDLLNVSPSGCRIPHFKNLFTPEIYGILKELGYKYSSSTCLTNTKSHGDPFVAQEGILEIPLSTCPKHPFTVFDTWHSLNSDRLFYRWIHDSEEQYLDLFRSLVEIGIETDSYINVYVDPYDVVVMKNFEEILLCLKEHERNLHIACYSDLLQDSCHQPEYATL